MREDDSMQKTDQNKNKQAHNEHVSASPALDDEQRVRVLSPGTLVAKRFFRNKLAMAGLVILVLMFLFSFVGGLLIPYSESQVFRKMESTMKDYAVISENKDFLYSAAEGIEFPSVAGAKMIQAIGKGEDTFEAKEVTYRLAKEGEDLYRILQLTPVYNVISLKAKHTITPVDEGTKVDAAIAAAFEEAVTAKADSFVVGEQEYFIDKSGRTSTISTMQEAALASKKVFASGQTLSFEFKLEAEKASLANAVSFIADERSYNLEQQEGSAVISLDGELYATMSIHSIQPAGNATLSLPFIQAAEKAAVQGDTSFLYTDASGNEAAYHVEGKAGQFVIKSEQMTQLNDSFASPGKEHLLGTDGNGMDVLTRLMYGGRISLMIGFVAIAIEICIGVIVGGLAGYFGKWVDTLLMRVVDVIICIPALPLYIIVGSVMDYYQIDPRARIYMLCAILGLVSWPGIARMVRGQILSFREQEFMTATEATGIRISRRIFKHLIPNVIPNLIVIATMGLGEVILMEATLSFLGLGVKFPFASWGNIINSVNNVYVMQNYLFVWVPAGFLILITVLGFNFVGDGLRDAFDPKMKR